MHFFFEKGFIFPNDFEILWTAMIVVYPYLTGVVAGAFIVSSVYLTFGKEVLRPVSRLAILTALAFIIFATLPLVAHLGRPERFLNIIFMPKFSSAMAGFSAIYTFFGILLVGQLWLTFRKDIVFLADNARYAPVRLMYKVMTLGSNDVSEKAMRFDKKAIKVFGVLGIPSACLLTGYVGFIFGAIKANPWWSSPIMPILFLTSAMLCGFSTILALYVFLCYLRKKPIAQDCVELLMKITFYLAIFDLSLEVLDVLNLAYMSDREWHLLYELITERLFWSLLVINWGVASLIPIALLGSSILFKNVFSLRLKTAIGLFSGALLLVQVLSMRWNIIIGGQLLSKSFRGFPNFELELFGMEGVLLPIFILFLPIPTLMILARIFPLWDDGTKIPVSWLRKEASAQGK